MADEAIPVKVVIIGDSNVGKTSVAMRFCQQRFKPNQPMTTMGEYHEVERRYENYRFKFVIWDTAGQERFQSITPLYYRGAKVAVIVYDITSKQSFDNIRRWHDQVSRNASSIKVVALCGNKCDCRNREVTIEEGSEIATELEMPFTECSALDGTNVEQLFQVVVDNLCEKEPIPESPTIVTDNAWVSVENENSKPSKKKKKSQCN